MHYLLMIIGNFNIRCADLSPAKTNAKLLVDSNTMLPFTIMRQSFEHIARWYLQIIKTVCRLKLANLPQRNSLKIHESPDSYPASKLFRILTFERNDHVGDSNAIR